MAIRPIWSYPMTAAQIAVRDNIPADLAYQVLDSLGMEVSQQDFSRLYGQAQLASDMVGREGEAGLDEIPDSSFIQHRSTVSSSGYLQQTLVHAVDKSTGATIEIPYSIRTDQLISRGEAIDAAIVSQTLRAPDYNLQVLGAAYTGTYQLVPGELEQAA